MYPAAFEYHAPTSVRDALGLMGRLGDDAKLLAGGHSLIPMMKLRLAQPKHVVDIGRIGGLSGGREEGGTIVVGAPTTPYTIGANAAPKAPSPPLPEGAAMIGRPQGTNPGGS